MFLKEFFLLLSLLICVKAQRNDESVAYSSNAFSFDLLKTLPKNQNLFFSPSSLYIALSMLYGGAKTSTAEAMQRVLKYDNVKLNGKTIHEALSDLMELLNNGSSQYRLETANALLYQQNYFLLPEFKEILKNYYSAMLKEIDFAGDNAGAIEEINAWVKEKTYEKIEKLVEDLPSNAVMVLMNAIYFKGTWKKTFDPELTRDATFHNEGVNKVTVPMMHIEDKFPSIWLHDKGLQAVEIPYKGEHISMLLVLPFEYDKLDEVEEKLDAESLDALISQMHSLKMKVSIPKFKLEDRREMKSNLTYLGLGNLFDTSADFSGINGQKNLYVSEVVHKAVIEVNEEGSEAAAATAVVIVEYSVKPRFYADHPFLFFIRDRRTNLILFCGRVTHL